MALQTVMNGRSTDREAKAIADAVGRLNDDEIITHEQLQSIANERRELPNGRPNGHYAAIIGRAKRLIRDEQHRVLISERGIGYKVATGEDQLRSRLGKIKRSVRGIARSTEEIAIIDDSRLPSKELIAARDHTVMNMRHLHALSVSQTKTLQLTVTKPQRK